MFIVNKTSIFIEILLKNEIKFEKNWKIYQKLKERFINSSKFFSKTYIPKHHKINVTRLSPNDTVHLRIKKNVCSNLTIPAMPPPSMMLTLLNLFSIHRLCTLNRHKYMVGRKVSFFFNENRPPIPIPRPLHMPSCFE